jgi:hypothetical protein
MGRASNRKWAKRAGRYIAARTVTGRIAAVRQIVKQQRLWTAIARMRMRG